MPVMKRVLLLESLKYLVLGNWYLVLHLPYALFCCIMFKFFSFLYTGICLAVPGTGSLLVPGYLVPFCTILTSLVAWLCTQYQKYSTCHAMDCSSFSLLLVTTASITSLRDNCILRLVRLHWVGCYCCRCLLFVGRRK